jgi:hypothetical protein
MHLSQLKKHQKACNAIIHGRSCPGSRGVLKNTG